MNFTTDLIPARLIKRYKRFLADVELASGDVVTAHCPDPGAMLGLKDPGSEVWLLPVPKSQKRKLRYTWQLIKAENTLVGINTLLPNTLVAEALAQHNIAELTHYSNVRREVPYGNNSRVDFLLSAEGEKDCYLEVKNVHLKRGNFAEFPDCVTDRGAKHMRELRTMVQQGHRAIVLYVVQREDCTQFKLASDLDPNYARAAQEAAQAGVETLCYRCHIGLEGISLDQALPIVLSKEYD